MTEIVTPGDRLAAEGKYTPGPGTYTSEGSIFALLAGTVLLATPSGRSAERQEISVSRSGAQLVLPKPDTIVTVKVTRVSPRFANAEILCVGSQPASATFSGVIRSQDVRATEVDKVELLSCFRPGDIVRASVVSVGDARSYYLSTARNELGVIYAKSLAGVPMVPISWQEMQCPQTKVIEQRKVAKTAA